MATHKHMSFLILFYALLSVLSSSKFGCGCTIRDYHNRSCVESEKQALLLFKQSLVDDLNYLSSWIGDDCCAWRGIGCNTKTGNVIRLDIRDGLLEGDHLYPSLLNLKYLTYLDLSNNGFSEMKIPQFLGSYKDLIYLNLSYSGFEGSVPHHLGNLSKLRYLDLSNNNYYYDNKSISDYYYDSFNSLLSIDDVRWLSGLSMLKYLDLTFVNLSRATDWFSSINMLSNSISVLGLFSCHLSNNIPHHLPLTNLTSLVSLDLRNNQLNSSFPLWVLNNSGLSHLYLGHNHFDGSIPDSIGTLTSLVELDLSENNFKGSIPESIGRLKSLSSLNLRDNQLESSFPLWVLNNSGLAHLYLGINYFDGSIPDSIGTLTSLLELDLSENNFKGPLPESMGSLTSLTLLCLGYNEFEGSIPKWIGNITALSALQLAGNKFKGSIPESIGHLTSLTYLDFSSNNFQGLIPQSIGNLTSLNSLDFSLNNFQGLIPHEIGNLTELTDLSMQSNELRGGLPEEVCRLSKLYWLEVGGSIPECIGELSNLDTLYLGSNSWEGFVTERHFVNLTMLTHLYISSKSNLALNVSNNWVPPFQLQYLSFDSLKVGPKFPSWLLTQRQIAFIFIIMINTSISDTIPVDWFASLLSQASTVDLSSNDINVEQLSSISAVPNGLDTLALSNNRFSGEFPSFLCNITSLITLVISSNNFSGELPHCLGNLTSLEYLDVMDNSFSGVIPVSLGSLVNLAYLNLYKNKFHGKLPASFQNLVNEADSDSEDERMWFYAGIGPGLLCGFLGFCASLHFFKSWRYSYFHFVELVFDKIALATALLRRKFQN